MTLIVLQYSWEYDFPMKWGDPMRKVLGLAGAALLFAGPSVAADLAVQEPVYKAPPVPVYNWTGFYIGGNLGGVISHPSGTSDFIDTGSIVEFHPQNNSVSGSGFLGGFQAGYNWQFSRWGVVGIEGDWDWGRAKYSFCRPIESLSVSCVDQGSGVDTFESKLNWLATVRGRFGVLAAPWLLVYGTGGGAWGSIDTTLSQSCLVNGCGGSNLPLTASQTTSATKGGWVAGVGIEATLTDHWLLRGEWLHVDLGTLSNTLTTAGQNSTTQTAVWSRAERFDEFRAALSYKF
jgi:outer membrane immunogenic protein